MAQLPHYWGEAVGHLSKRDTVLSRIIARYPEVKLRLKKDPFTTLARAIAGQQISVKAADTIWGRFVAASEGKPQKVNPQKILSLKTKDLRACGLSERKAEYIQGLASRFAAKEISGRAHSKMPDHEIKAELVSLKGIGPWTADMYLMFNLWRPNVLPLGDVGLIRAIEVNYFKGCKTTLKKIRTVTEPWSPFATVATWYLWRSLDPIPVEY